MTTDNNFEGKSFKELSQALEQTVAALESNTLELEDAVAKYKEGVALVEELNKRLANAKQQITYVNEAAPSQSNASSVSPF